MDGHDLMNSMFDTFDLMGIIYLSASYIVFNKFTEVNTLATIIGKHVQVWVYLSALAINSDPYPNWSKTLFSCLDFVKPEEN